MQAFWGLALILAGVLSPPFRTSPFSGPLDVLLGIVPCFGVQARSPPVHTLNYFENLPSRLYYFDDTTVSNL